MTEPKPQSEEAYQRLREAILSARLLPGEHLGEVKCSEALQVGRFAIREGLRRLHGEGLVTRTRNKYRVTVPTADDIRQITHLRAVLETGALRFLSGQQLDEHFLAPIREAAADYADLVLKGYHAGAHEADLRFHQAIVAASQNPRLLRLYESSNLPILQVSIGQNPSLLDDYQQVVAEHAAILEAIEAGEMRTAARHLEDHLRRGEDTILANPAPLAAPSALIERL